MGRKSKYTIDQKVKAILDYKSGNSKVADICNALGLHQSGKDLYNWIAIYDKYGEAGFLPKERNKVYSKTLKDAAIQDYLIGKGSYKEIARKYEIWSSRTLENWVVKFLEYYDSEKPKPITNKNELEELRLENLQLKRELELKEKENILLIKIKKKESELNSRQGAFESKYIIIKEQHDTLQWSINWMCKVLHISRAGYYKWLHRT